MRTVPYIVTARQTGIAEPGEKFQRGTPPRAVATLNEAMQAVQDAIDNGPGITSRAAFTTLCESAANVPESGGTVGPLPDGTLIEVRPVDFTELADGAKFPSAQAILDAFNAR